MVPTHSLELIWKNYEGFENGVAVANSSAGGSAAAAAKQFSSRVLQEQRPRFNAARMAYRCVGVMRVRNEPQNQPKTRWLGAKDGILAPIIVLYCSVLFCSRRLFQLSLAGRIRTIAMRYSSW